MNLQQWQHVVVALHCSHPFFGLPTALKHSFLGSWKRASTVSDFSLHLSLDLDFKACLLSAFGWTVMQLSPDKPNKTSLQLLQLGGCGRHCLVDLLNQWLNSSARALLPPFVLVGVAPAIHGWPLGTSCCCSFHLNGWCHNHASSNRTCLKPLLSQCIFDCILLILDLLLPVEAVVTGVCSCNGTIAQLDLCLKFLDPCCHGIHLLAHADLLFIEKSPALCLRESIRSHCTVLKKQCATSNCTVLFNLTGSKVMTLYRARCSATHHLAQTKQLVALRKVKNNCIFLQLVQSKILLWKKPPFFINFQPHPLKFLEGAKEKQ